MCAVCRRGPPAVPLPSTIHHPPLATRPQIHWPGKFLRPSPDNTALNKRLRLETWRELEALHQKGKVRHIGVSNYGEGPFKELLSYAKVRPSVNQVGRHRRPPPPPLSPEPRAPSPEPRAPSTEHRAPTADAADTADTAYTILVRDPPVQFKKRIGRPMPARRRHRQRVQPSRGQRKRRRGDGPAAGRPGDLSRRQGPPEDRSSGALTDK